MISVSFFKLIYNIGTGFFTIFSYERAYCPLCGGELIYRDSKARESKNMFGDIRHFILRHQGVVMKISVLLFEPGEEPRPVEVENDLISLRRLIGGYYKGMFDW